MAGALGAALVAGAPAAHAVDGVVEINQAKANAGGVTSGDAALFPVSITAPGSYRLTSNLSVPGGIGAADIHGIEITADDVTLDLNGFTISCRRNTLPASPCSSASGIGDGIVINGDRVRVENGRIVDMADDGLTVGSNKFYVVDAVLVSNNGGDGLRIGLASSGQVFRSAFLGNEGAGISSLSNASAFVRDTTTAGNASSGVDFADSTSIIWAAEVILRDESFDFLGGVRIVGCVVFGISRQCPVPP